MLDLNQTGGEKIKFMCTKEGNAYFTLFTTCALRWLTTPKQLRSLVINLTEGSYMLN